jgi:ribosomal protein S18 acetylase RimI-like enzyme
MILEGYPRETIIGKGEIITLRPMVRGDREDIMLFFTTLCEREKLYLRDDDINPAIAVPWPGDMDYSRALPILALAGERIVGIATLYRSDSAWMMHMGYIRVTVSQEYRRKGLGRALAGELFKNSLKCRLDKIVAEIVKDQIDVSLFYNGLGFRTEASLNGHFLDDNGTKHDVIIMSNSVKQLWKYWVERNGDVKSVKRARAQ